MTNSLDEYETGEVTEFLRGLGDGRDGLFADDRLFDTVVSQLRRQAAAVLRGFPTARSVEADDLVNEFWTRLASKLAHADIQDRRHFFALACKNFRWILLDMRKAANAGRECLPSTEIPSTMTGPATLARRRLEFEEVARFIEDSTSLSGEMREILNMRHLLGMTFQQVADTIGMPLATVHLRHQEALDMIQRHFDGGNHAQQ